MNHKESIENCLRMFAMKVLYKRAIDEVDIAECMKMLEQVENRWRT
jgi:hypothetical protein